jgi:hypothetical protein
LLPGPVTKVIDQNFVEEHELDNAFLSSSIADGEISGQA